MAEETKRLGPYLELLKNPAPPKCDWETSDVLLFEMVQALAERFSPHREIMHSLARKEGDSVTIHGALPLEWSRGGRTLPLTGLHVLYGVVSESLKRAKLSEAHRHECALRALNACVTALGESWEDYVTFLALPGIDLALSEERMKAAAEELNAGIEIDFVHDFTNLAIYAKDNPQKVYVHRELRRLWPLKDGRIVDVIPPLMVHEVVEKCLMDELRFSDRRYQKCHQVAQRIEEAAATALHIPWDEYQDEIMAPAIIAIPLSLPIEGQPRDADVLPMIDLGETVVVEELQAAAALPPLSSQLLAEGDSLQIGDICTVRKLKNGLFHLLFTDGKRMASALMRFQEYCESPKFRDTHFTREEFDAWYPEVHEGRTYVQNWQDAGFNVPGTGFASFYDGWFNPLTEDEAALLRFFYEDRKTPLYVIATAVASPQGVLEHELVHGLEFLHPEYKREAEQILAEYDLEPLKQFLHTHPEYGYHPEVLQDEAHAYLTFPTDDLREFGFDTEVYAEATKELQSLHKRFMA